jgi:serine/threonine protein phosphatase PrpC
MLIVCDGMGGVEGGEVASSSRQVMGEMKGTRDHDPEVFCAAPAAAARVTNQDVRAVAGASPGSRHGRDVRCRRER